MPQFRKLSLKNFKTSNFTLIWNYFLIILFLLAVKFISQRPGILFGQCSEICGANHSFMPYY